MRICKFLKMMDVFIIPPAEWKRHDDFKAHSCWKAKTVWYGRASCSTGVSRFFWQVIFVKWVGIRGKRDPTKFVFLERCL